MPSLKGLRNEFSFIKGNYAVLVTSWIMVDFARIHHAARAGTWASNLVALSMFSYNSRNHVVVSIYLVCARY